MYPVFPPRALESSILSTAIPAESSGSFVTMRPYIKGGWYRKTCEYITLNNSSICVFKTDQRETRKRLVCITVIYWLIDVTGQAASNAWRIIIIARFCFTSYLLPPSMIPCWIACSRDLVYRLVTFRSSPAFECSKFWDKCNLPSSKNIATIERSAK